MPSKICSEAPTVHPDLFPPIDIVPDKTCRFKRDDGTLGSYEVTYERFPTLRIGEYLLYYGGEAAQRRVIFHVTDRRRIPTDDDPESSYIDTVEGVLAVEITPGLGWFVQLPRDGHAFDPEYRVLLDLFDRLPLVRQESKDEKPGIHFISDELAEMVVTKRYDEPFYRFSRREGARSLEPFIVEPEALIRSERPPS
jgi:hypothetical protein